MKTILVTGGAGFIGHHLVKDLLHWEDAKVLVLDDLSTGDENNLDLENPNLALLKGDISNTEDVAACFDLFKFDEVYHLAALARIQRSWDEPERTYNVNVTGTNNILEYCRKYDVPNIFITSSSSIFAGYSLITEPEPMHVGYKHSPLNPYAWHKHLNEETAKLYMQSFKMKIGIGRPFNVYGEGQKFGGAYSTVVPQFIEQKKNGEKLTVYGDGSQTRDFTYVKDLVNMIKFACKNGGAYNMCSSKRTSVLDIAKAFSYEYVLMDNPRQGEASWSWGLNNTGVPITTDIIEWINENYG